MQQQPAAAPPSAQAVQAQLALVTPPAVQAAKVLLAALVVQLLLSVLIGFDGGAVLIAIGVTYCCGIRGLQEQNPRRVAWHVRIQYCCACLSVLSIVALASAAGAARCYCDDSCYSSWQPQDDMPVGAPEPYPVAPPAPSSQNVVSVPSSGGVPVETPTRPTHLKPNSGGHAKPEFGGMRKLAAMAMRHVAGGMHHHHRHLHGDAPHHPMHDHAHHAHHYHNHRRRLHGHGHGHHARLARFLHWIGGDAHAPRPAEHHRPEATDEVRILPFPDDAAAPQHDIAQPAPAPAPSANQRPHVRLGRAHHNPHLGAVASSSHPASDASNAQAPVRALQSGSTIEEVPIPAPEEDLTPIPDQTEEEQTEETPSTAATTTTGAEDATDASAPVPVAPQPSEHNEEEEEEDDDEDEDEDRHGWSMGGDWGEGGWPGDHRDPEADARVREQVCRATAKGGIAAALGVAMVACGVMVFLHCRAARLGRRALRVMRLAHAMQGPAPIVPPPPPPGVAVPPGYALVPQSMLAAHAAAQPLSDYPLAGTGAGAGAVPAGAGAAAVMPMPVQRDGGGHGFGGWARSPFAGLTTAVTSMFSGRRRGGYAPVGGIFGDASDDDYGGVFGRGPLPPPSDGTAVELAPRAPMAVVATEPPASHTPAYLPTGTGTVAAYPTPSAPGSAMTYDQYLAHIQAARSGVVLQTPSASTQL